MLTNTELLRVEHLAKKYDETNIPLYLSYPVSSWWRMHPDESVFCNAYPHDAASPFLYFHFPYCANSCYYCACFKAESSDPFQNDIYIGFLEKEFNYKRRLLGIDTFKAVRHLHWGGGTPTHMSVGQIETIFTAISKHIRFAADDDTSISIEAYPDKKELSLAKLRLLRALGFNEISFGIQDIDPIIQQVINRRHPVEDLHDIVAASRELGFRVHVDLCYGLPFQGINELQRTIDAVARMAPDRVAMFSYAHYPMAFPLQRKIPASAIPNSFMRTVLNMTASQQFADHGYCKVGYDHFVKSDNALRHAAERQEIVRDFMGYSVDRRREFIGFGTAAISFLGNLLFQNAIAVQDYFSALEATRFPAQPNMGHILSDDDLVRNRMIQKHILGGFHIPRQKNNGLDLDAYFTSELRALEPFKNDQLIEETADGISMTPLGKYFVRHIARVFDKYS